MGNWAAIETTATAQHGLVTTRQIAAAGEGRLQIARRVAAGTLVPVRRGVYALTAAPFSWEQRVLVACLHPTQLVVASHLTAARHYGFFDSDEIHVTVRYPSDVRVPGATVHRSRDLDDHDIVVVGPTPFTSPVRTLVDLGHCLPPCEVQRVVDHVMAAGMVPLERLWAIRRRVGKQGRNGAGVLGDVLAQVPPDSKLAESGPEIAVLRLLLADGLPPPVQQHEVECDGRRFRLDLAYPDAWLAIEYDGEEWHSSADQRACDEARQRALERQGWSFVRLTKEDLAFERRHAWLREIGRSVERKRDL